MATAAWELAQTPRVPGEGLRRHPARFAVAALVLALALLVPARLGATTPVAASPQTSVVIAPGDTIWELGRAHAPTGRHPREYVADILAANDLDATGLQPGTVVRLP